MQEKIVDVAQELQDRADECVNFIDNGVQCLISYHRKLRNLNLPSALEALERPIGLPPSLLRKAEEVRLEDGPAKIGASIEDVERLSHQDLAILEEVGFSIISSFELFDPFLCRPWTSWTEKLLKMKRPEKRCH